MLLARDNLSLAMAEDEAVTLRLTNYLVPAAFGLILTLGLLGNFMVIGVVRDGNLIIRLLKYYRILQKKWVVWCWLDKAQTHS